MYLALGSVHILVVLRKDIHEIVDTRYVTTRTDTVVLAKTL